MLKVNVFPPHPQAIEISGILIEANEKSIGNEKPSIEHNFTVKNSESHEEIDHEKEGL